MAETPEFRGNYKYNLLDAICAPSTPKSRCSRNGTTMRSPTTGARASRCGRLQGEHAHAGRARQSCVPRTTCRWEAPAEAGRIYRKIAYGPLLDIFMLDMRSYRTPNSDGDEALIFGETQLAWLKRELMNSRATWKVIAADLPIGVVHSDAVALGNGPPRGREHEVADLLAFIKHANVRNTVWLTADVHYTAAHYYDPNRAVFQDFDPFWEFISGPLHAGTWHPGRLDNTFGPRGLR